MVPAGAAAVADAAGGHGFRHGGSQHHLRSDWREVLGLPRRKRSEESFEDSEGTRNRRSCINKKRLTGLGKREHSDVDAEESEVPKADARAPQRQSLARRRFGVRRVRIEGHGMRVDYRPAD